MPSATAHGMSRERVKLALCLFNETDELMTLDVDSFLRAAGVSAEQAKVIDMYRTAPTEADLQGRDAVIIGGSRLSVWEQVPHGAELAAFVKAARAKKVPVLGVCFGAQFLAHVFGGKVERDHSREERGTFEITSSDDSFTDLLFADVPFTFLAQQAHHDCITALPAGATVLASSAVCPVQAFVIGGADIYGVQFHPERSREDYERSLALSVKNGVRTQEAADAIRARLKETPEAEAIVGKFIDRVVLGR